MVYEIKHVHGPIYQTQTNWNDFTHWQEGLIEWIEAVTPLNFVPGAVLVVALEGWEKKLEVERDSVICTIKDVDHKGAKVIDRDEQGLPLTMEASYRVGDFVKLTGGKIE